MDTWYYASEALCVSIFRLLVELGLILCTHESGIFTVS